MPVLDRLAHGNQGDGPPLSPPRLSGGVHRASPRRAPAHLAVKLGGVLPLHVGAASRAPCSPSSRMRSGTSTSLPFPSSPGCRSSPASEARIAGTCYTKSGAPASRSATRTSLPGSATVGAPVFDHRGARCRAALAFNLLPGLSIATRDRYMELARAASIEASRAFGYDLAANGLPVPSSTTKERPMELTWSRCSASTTALRSSPAGHQGSVPPSRGGLAGRRRHRRTRGHQRGTGS